MFGMYQPALEMEVKRRREILAGSMRAARGASPRTGRVQDTVKFRHVLAALSTILG